jgi:ferredoxin
LKICVEIDDNLTFRSELASEIARRWPDVLVSGSSQIELPHGVEGLLVVGSDVRNTSDEESLLLQVERVPTSGLDFAQTLFQVNANIGKITKADLIKSRLSAKPDDKIARLSRRDMISGIKSLGRFQRYSDAPVVYNSICEAKYGCTKCLQACPTGALSIQNGTIVLTDSKCERLGPCASICPVSAIQLPEFSESQFIGLVYGMIMTEAPRRTLVVTCNKNVVQPAPWMFVEQVRDIGMIGPRHLAIAASSGIDTFIIYCADGLCKGKTQAIAVTESMIRFLGGTGEENGNKTITLRYLEGLGGGGEMKRINDLPKIPAKVLFVPGRDSWANYIRALQALAPPDAIAVGLGLSDLEISSTCTLCKTCEKYCPHSALKIVSGSLKFESSKCTGCGLCAQMCPERSIMLRSLERFSQLQEREIFRDEIVNCAKCGRPLDSAKYLARVASLLGKEDPMMKYCNPCKQRMAFESIMGKGKKN